MKFRWKWLPSWDMPSDPVKAVFWFLHWSLQVLVRYFFVLIIAGAAYETYLNGVIGLLGTLLIGLLVWGLLVVLLGVLSFIMGVSSVLTEVNRLSQNPFTNSGFSPFTRQPPEEEENIVEGSIITDLDQERKKRRQEM